MHVCPDKFIFTLSWIPWKQHTVAGTAFMYHRSIQDTLAERFMVAFNECVEAPGHWNQCHCGSDQILFSEIRKKHSDFFHQIGYGYGHVIARMFLDHDPVSNVTEFKDLCYEQNGIDVVLKSWRKPAIDNMCADVWGSREGGALLASTKVVGGERRKHKRKHKQLLQTAESLPQP